MLDDIVSNDFAVKKEVKVSYKILCHNYTLILVYLCKIFSSLSRIYHWQKGGSIEPFELLWVRPCIVFNYNYHNSVSKKVNIQVH